MLARRWYVLVPCLLLTLGGMVVAVGTSSQSYEAQGQVVLLAAPSPPAPTEQNPTPPSANNPYTQMELSDVVDVVSSALGSDTIAGQLAGEGVTDTYTVAGNKDFQRGPIMDLTVTASSERAAFAQYPLLRDRVATTLRDLQLDAGANPDYLITSQEITPPSVQGATVLAKLRAAIIVLIIGLVLTLAAVFSFDAIARSRQARGADEATDDARRPLDEPQPERTDDDTPAEAPQPATVGARSDDRAPDSSAPDPSAPDPSAPDPSAPDPSAPDPSAPDADEAVLATDDAPTQEATSSTPSRRTNGAKQASTNRNRSSGNAGSANRSSGNRSSGNKTQNGSPSKSRNGNQRRPARQGPSGAQTTESTPPDPTADR